MAQGDLSTEQFQQQMDKEEEQRLKYLEFVQVAAIHTALCLSNLYVYAKHKAGPLRPGVETVEGTVKTVVGPVYDQFHGIPIDFLKYVDRKVDESVTKIDYCVPPTIKQVSSQAISAAQKAPEVARSIACEVKRVCVKDTASGFAKSVYTKYEPTAKELYAKYEPTAKELYAKYEPTAKKLYAKYEPKAEQCAVTMWHKLNQLPLFPQVAQVMVPTAAYCSEKYNETVQLTSEKGYRVSSYLSLVPIEKIAKVFGDNGALSQPLLLKRGETNVVIH